MIYVSVLTKIHAEYTTEKKNSYSGYAGWVSGKCSHVYIHWKGYIDYQLVGVQ